MPKERLKSPRARLFVALDLPGAARQRIVAWQRAEVVDPALRPVAPESLHITLAFLGYHPERDVEGIAAALEGLATPAPELVLLPDPIAVGRGRETRLYALGAEDVPPAADRASALAGEVQEGGLAQAGFYRPEKRPWWPHLTVARVRRDRARRGHYARVERPPGRLPDPLLEPFVAVRVTLYRSILRPQGAEYRPVAKFELPREAAKR